MRTWQIKGILSTSCVIFSYPKLLSISVLTFIKWRLNTELLMNTLRNIRFLPSIVAEKNVTKNILEGRTDRGKTVYLPPPSGSGGIIRSKIGSKCVDLILIRLAKCWNNFFLQNFVYNYTVKMASIWLYCEKVKSEYIFLSCPANFCSSRFRIKIIF